MVRKILQAKLRLIAWLVVRKHSPLVIAITGSVGKTGTKDAVIKIVSDNGYRVRGTSGNYNNEIGVPLTIIGSTSGGSSWLSWFLIILKGVRMVLIPAAYPDVLVLEMAADRPGDIGYLAKIAPPDIAIVTAISSVHLEFFKSVESVATEKGSLLQYLKSNGTAILNADDKRVLDLKSRYHKKFLTYGIISKSDVQANNIALVYDKDPHLKAIVLAHAQQCSLILPNFIARHHLYGILAAISAGIALKIPLSNIVLSLKDLTPPKGRMTILPGVKHTTIIDDSYNSSPQAAVEALNTLKQLAARRKTIAVLGDMLELGSYTQKAHFELGHTLAKLKITDLITVGEKATDIAQGAIKAGMSKSKIFSFDNAPAAGRFLQDRMRQGDFILIKGSQGVRTEKIVKEVMANPEKAKDLLVRQGPEWQS
ncbi:MAG: hypothetical protein COT81_01060 [Candidatus Buchananbacteria bacterium CG10_big_fil_rev_8_21_14_0_10_42_9]|uniref:UDP-N-acetylmuramoyl-tripeptide--D-alanyl-D-alanine ligase n=1 Tax=Candidatus Buchananbacteria bacterium CG10_big_fil_rev_8_21_14_0_10_42_9 TaxID=1974526 RepID=A0A2H0W498_9BACT|nr:MAG: hypothetical protein COT81_01060 [Candidatus Buchananbacteria bacterium CG10_big_fil_rev_8_21_14_0_10_42_9]